MKLNGMEKRKLDWTKCVGITAALLAIWAAGCATNEFSVGTHYNEISGLRTDLLENNLLRGEMDPPRELIWLNASRVYTDFRNYQHFLEISYMAPIEVGYLDIGPGASLTIVADGKETSFRGAGSLNTRKQHGEFVHENALYRASEADIEMFATSREVVVRVIGNNGIVERKFEEDNFQRFIQFNSIITDQVVW
jgi:hypothetical protein